MRTDTTDSDDASTLTEAGTHVQTGILDESGTSYCVQQYQMSLGADVAALRSAIGVIRDLAGTEEGPAHVVVAFGASLLGTLAPAEMPAGMRPFTRIDGTDGHGIPATQDDLFLWFTADTADRCLAGAWQARGHLDGLAELTAETSGFRYFANQDLTGFEDGTENPQGAERIEVVAIPEGPSGGGSFVLAQRWVHDLRGFERLSLDEQEAVIGRTKADSIELDPLPERSHVERVVVTDDDGSEREIYRRSFPYGTTDELGLFFLAFNRDLATFQDMLERMLGAAD
ncbi:MAG: Dyp-type peroxidase, partial [Actinobacteria bacterium]|nr:Dyp-type peroxidase [Actinomycetota bacterium]